MAFPWCQGDFRVLATCTAGIDVRAIEEDVVTWRWGSAVKLALSLESLSGPVVPVRNGLWTQVDIVRKRCRSVNHNRANNSVPVLRAEVRVVPKAYVRRHASRET